MKILFILGLILGLIFLIYGGYGIYRGRKELFEYFGFFSFVISLWQFWGGNSVNNKSEPTMEPQAISTEVSEEFGNENKNDDTNTQKIIMSESKYLEYLQDHVEGDIVYNHYGDYDGNGSCEMFALVGELTTDTVVGEGENLYGKIWYISEDGAREVESEDIEYWTSPHIFTVGGNIFIAFEKAYTTGSQTYIWGVREGKPYQPNISGKVHGLVSVNEYDEIEVTHSTYDALYDKSIDSELGHTWKKYYFYFDGSTFKEYGGIDITVDDVLRIPKGKKVIDEVYKHSYDIDSIYYRSNKVININISKKDNGMIDYYNITLRYIDNKWKIVSPDELDMDYGEGYYLKAFIPSVATYPDKYPY